MCVTKFSTKLIRSWYDEYKQCRSATTECMIQLNVQDFIIMNHTQKAGSSLFYSFHTTLETVHRTQS
jgi:hypothetical protein